MKLLSLIVVLCAYQSANLAFAQAPANTGEHKKKLEIFSNWIGQWKGVGNMQRGPNNTSSSEVTENIEMRLDGAIVIVEGIGKKIR